MASPQKENGHLDLANELVDELAQTHISSAETQCLWLIFRKTWGWQKKEDLISLSQFTKKTRLTRKTVCRALNRLKGKNIISVQTDTSGISKYRPNKDYEKWKVVSKRTLVVSEMSQGSVQTVPKAVSKRTHTITNITNTTNTKTNTRVRFEEFWKLYPRKRKRDDALKAWKQINPDKELFERIVKAVEAQKNWVDWKKEGGKYIPYPATWLRGGCWNDEADGPMAEQEPHLMTAEELRKERYDQAG